MRTLDWKRLESFIAERQPAEVSAGILNDWFCTAATVYENGAWKPDGKERAWVTSHWAQPGFKATMPNGDVIEVAADREETPEEGEARSLKDEQARKNLREAVAAKARRARSG